MPPESGKLECLVKYTSDVCAKLIYAVILYEHRRLIAVVLPRISQRSTSVAVTPDDSYRSCVSRTTIATTEPLKSEERKHERNWHGLQRIVYDPLPTFSLLFQSKVYPLWIQSETSPYQCQWNKYSGKNHLGRKRRERKKPKVIATWCQAAIILFDSELRNAHDFKSLLSYKFARCSRVLVWAHKWRHQRQLLRTFWFGYTYIYRTSAFARLFFAKSPKTIARMLTPTSLAQTQCKYYGSSRDQRMCEKAVPAAPYFHLGLDFPLPIPARLRCRPSLRGCVSIRRRSPVCLFPPFLTLLLLLLLKIKHNVCNIRCVSVGKKH